MPNAECALPNGGSTVPAKTKRDGCRCVRWQCATSATMRRRTRTVSEARARGGVSAAASSPGCTHEVRPTKIFPNTIQICTNERNQGGPPRMPASLQRPLHTERGEGGEGGVCKAAVRMPDSQARKVGASFLLLTVSKICGLLLQLPELRGVARPLASRPLHCRLPGAAPPCLPHCRRARKRADSAPPPEK